MVVGGPRKTLENLRKKAFFAHLFQRNFLNYLKHTKKLDGNLSQDKKKFFILIYSNSMSMSTSFWKGIVTFNS